MKLIIQIAMVLLLSAVASCAEDFDEVNAEAIEQKLEDSVNHTAVSWWYVGQDDDFHYIVEKWPMEQIRYKVRRDSVRIDTKAPTGMILKESDWVNLKVEQIHFLR